MRRLDERMTRMSERIMTQVVDQNENNVWDAGCLAGGIFTARADSAGDQQEKQGIFHV